MHRIVVLFAGLWVLLGTLTVRLQAQSQSTRASSISLIKNSAYGQTSSAGVTLLTHEFRSRIVLVEVPTVSFGGTLAAPGGLTDDYIRAPSGALEFNQNYVTAAVLDTRYPYGAYIIRLQGPLASTYGLTLPFTERPAPPVIANWDSLQGIATPDHCTISWTPIQGGLATDLVTLTIGSDDGTFSYNSADAGVRLTGRATEISLRLPPGQRFTAELVCLRGRITPSGGSFPYTTTLGTSASTRFPLATLYPLPTITVHPVSQAVVSDSSISLSVSAAGIGPLSYQWRQNGSDIRGATAATLRLDNVQAAQAGEYSVVVSNPGGRLASNPAVVAVAVNARLINLATRGQAGSGGGELVAGFVLAGAGAKTVLIRAIGPGLADFGLSTNEVLADPTLTLSSGGEVVARNDDWEQGELSPLRAATTAVGAFALRANSRDSAILIRLPAGAYTASVASKDATLGVAMVEVYNVDPPGVGPRLINLATRAIVGPGGQILIPGFVVSGDTTRRYLLRGVGPTLAEFNQTGLLQDPVLTVFRGAIPIYANDDWTSDAGAAITSTVSAQVGAFSLRSNSQDAAFVVQLAPGAYTFQLAGKNSASGLALVEIYEVP